MKLTNEEIQRIIRISDGASEYKGVHKTYNIEQLKEILALRQEVGRLKAQQSEVAARAVNSVKDWFVDLSENHNSTTISEMCEWSAKQIAVYQVREQGHE